jgi:hypothetical protein
MPPRGDLQVSCLLLPDIFGEARRPQRNGSRLRQGLLYDVGSVINPWIIVSASVCLFKQTFQGTDERVSLYRIFYHLPGLKNMPQLVGTVSTSFLRSAAAGAVSMSCIKHILQLFL